MSDPTAATGRPEEVDLSIFATWLMFADAEDHGETYRYEASHVMPTEDHRGGPCFDIAAIPADVRDEDADPDTVLPWLRVSLGQEDAVIDMRQANALRLALGLWLDRQAPRKDGDR